MRSFSAFLVSAKIVYCSITAGADDAGGTTSDAVGIEASLCSRRPGRFLESELMLEMMTSMTRIDRLAFTLSTCPSTDIQKLPRLALTATETLQYLIDVSVYRVISACVLDPDTNVYLHTDFSNLSFIANRFENTLISVLTPAFARLAPYLVHLDLSGTEVSDISVLSSFSRLRCLKLANTRVTNLDQLQPLAATIEDLDLTGTSIADISILRSFARLDHLYLANTRVTSIDPLQIVAESFIHLDVSGTQISDFSALSLFAHLTFLKLANTCISNLGPLHRLAGSLEYLDVSDTQVSDLSVLSSFVRLTHLYLANTRVTSLQPLQLLAAPLIYLVLNGDEITDFEPLRNWTQMLCLHVQDATFNVASLGALATLPEVSVYVLTEKDGNAALDTIAKAVARREGVLGQIQVASEEALTTSLGHFEERNVGTLGVFDVMVRGWGSVRLSFDRHFE